MYEDTVRTGKANIIYAKYEHLKFVLKSITKVNELLSMCASDAELKHIKPQRDILAERWNFEPCQLLKTRVVNIYGSCSPGREVIISKITLIDLKASTWKLGRIPSAMIPTIFIPSRRWRLYPLWKHPVWPLLATPTDTKQSPLRQNENDEKHTHKKC